VSFFASPTWCQGLVADDYLPSIRHTEMHVVPEAHCLDAAWPQLQERDVIRSRVGGRLPVVRSESRPEADGDARMRRDMARV
jgi:hypothetical protein